MAAASFPGFGSRPISVYALFPTTSATRPAASAADERILPLPASSAPNVRISCAARAPSRPRTAARQPASAVASGRPQNSYWNAPGATEYSHWSPREEEGCGHAR